MSLPIPTRARGDALGSSWGRSSLPAGLGLVLPLAMLAAVEGPALALRLALVLVVTLALQMLFARLRQHPFDFYGIVTAGLVTMAVPASAPLYQLLLAIVFGVVIGEQVFGGRGRSFLHPAVVTLAFLTFSFADQDYRTGPVFLSWTLLPALLLLVLSGQASWRVLLASGVALVGLGALQGQAEPWAVLLQGGVPLVLLYLAADPVSSAATDPGRWVYGALVGALAALFAQIGPAFGAAVFAVLLASIFAPLIDRLVIAGHVVWRERRHG